jgi:hypothetical protein
MIILILIGLMLWVVVAYWMLANQPGEYLDYCDQLVFAFWPLTVPAVIVFDVSVWLICKLRQRRNG